MRTKWRHGSDASATQYEVPREPIDLTIGLDFGTSSAKVVIRSPYLGRENATVVRWSNGRGGETPLLPTSLQEGPDGRFRIDHDDGPSHQDIKVALLDEPDSLEARAVAAVYLAWVLRSSRQYVLANQAKVYGKYFLRWALNLGIPSAGYDDEATKEAFRIVGEVAWNLSVQSRSPTLDDARSYLSGELPDDQDVRVEVIPEIVAAVHGYAQSRERREGLHVILDVGASTIDVCGFILHAPEDEDNYELLTALVEPLGVHALHRTRLHAIRETGCSARPGLPASAADPFASVPTAADDYVEDPPIELLEELHRIDAAYRTECGAALLRELWSLRTRRHPLAAHWESGLPIFVTGGGRDFPSIGKALRHAEAETRKLAVDVSAFRYGALSSTLDAWGNEKIEDELKERLAVAYGLSFVEIGHVRGPQQIPDRKLVPPEEMPQRPVRDYWAGKR